MLFRRTVLYPRADHAPVGAEDAAIPVFGPQLLTAVHAGIKELARVGRHLLSALPTAMRALDRRNKFD